MKLALFFAFRYLFSKKSVNAINIISTISVIGVLVSSAALVIVLSFYNGMEKLILSLNSTFTPELRIEPVKGKTFDPNTDFLHSLRKDGDVKSFSHILEEKILVEYNHQQFIARIRGVEPESLKKTASREILYAGDFNIMQDGLPYAIVGAQLQSNLRIPIANNDSYVKLYTPRKGASGKGINPIDDINIRNITPRGILQYEPGFDDLVITPISFAKDLLNEPTKVSAIELYTNDSAKGLALQQMIQQELGEDFYVKNREQQNPLLYKTIKSEKWIVFFILTTIGIIAVFNIIGSLTMLVIDKKSDMTVLTSLGANNALIQRIFFYEGLIIAFLGSLIGVTLGLGFCLLQQEFGFIQPEGSANTIMDTYPVDIRISDFVLVFITIMVVATLVSYVASRLSVKEIQAQPRNNID